VASGSVTTQEESPCPLGQLRGHSGAGVVPIAVLPDREVVVLFHTKQAGSKVGYLVDFGGAASEQETVLETAARELSEETGGVFDLHPEELCQQPFHSTHLLQQSPLTLLAAQRRRDHLLRVLRGGGEVEEARQEQVWHGSTGDGGYQVFFLWVSFVSSAHLDQLFSYSDRRCCFQWVPLASLLPDSPSPPPLPLHPRLVALQKLDSIWTSVASFFQEVTPCPHE